MRTFFEWGNDPKSVRRQRLKTLSIIIPAIATPITFAITNPDKVEQLLRLFNLL